MPWNVLILTSSLLLAGCATVPAVRVSCGAEPHVMAASVVDDLLAKARKGDAGAASTLVGHDKDVRKYESCKRRGGL
jgi:hypothetical protein